MTEVTRLESNDAGVAAADSEPATRPAVEMLELTRPECLRLLAETAVGRIVVSVTGWDHPMIRPVNYVFDTSSQSVLIRSAIGSKLRALLHSSRAAFEIDWIDPAGRVGWSVIVVGVTEEIVNVAELARLDGLGFEPWAPGAKDHWICIRVNAVSGRRIARVTELKMTAPVALARDLHLRDGRTVSVRPVTPDDEEAILEFLTGLSEGSRRLRFFSAAVDLRAEARRGAAGDDPEHHGLLALAPGRGVVGHAIYVRLPHSERAEVAVEVADDFHHLGLATLLMIRLAQLAEERQITRFFAEVLPENRDMLTVFRDGFAASTLIGRDDVEVEFSTSSWRDAHARFEL
jgi:uncharacterized protein